MSLLVICKTFGLFFNTLTANDKYPLLNKGNLTQPIQMQSSKTPQIFSKFFCLFLKSTSIFEDLEKTDDLHSSCIPETGDWERRG